MKKLIFLSALILGSLVNSLNAQECQGITTYVVDTTIVLDNGMSLDKVYYVTPQQYTGKLRCCLFSMDIAAYPDTFALKAKLRSLVAMTADSIPVRFTSVSDYKLSEWQLIQLNFATGEFKNVFKTIIAEGLKIGEDKITIITVND